MSQCLSVIKIKIKFFFFHYFEKTRKLKSYTHIFIQQLFLNQTKKSQELSKNIKNDII